MRRCGLILRGCTRHLSWAGKKEGQACFMVRFVLGVKQKQMTEEQICPGVGPGAHLKSTPGKATVAGPGSGQGSWTAGPEHAGPCGFFLLGRAPSSCSGLPQRLTLGWEMGWTQRPVTCSQGLALQQRAAQRDICFHSWLAPDRAGRSPWRIMQPRGCLPVPLPWAPQEASEDRRHHW